MVAPLSFDLKRYKVTCHVLIWQYFDTSLHQSDLYERTTAPGAFVHEMRIDRISHHPNRQSCPKFDIVLVPIIYGKIKLYFCENLVDIRKSRFGDGPGGIIVLNLVCSYDPQSRLTQMNCKICVDRVNKNSDDAMFQ